MKTAFNFLIFLLFAFTLSALIINIPEDFTTIQAGIDASINGDTVLVQPGTYNQNINFNGKNITVGSLYLTTHNIEYLSQTIIYGNHNGHVVTFADNEDSTAVLTGFTITNGYTSYLHGGGIYCYQSCPSILSNYITDNVGNDCGGGIYCYNASPLLTDLTISENTAQSGGGICCDTNSNPRLVDVTITDNSTAGSIVSVGGGISCINNSNPSLINVTISDNTARYGGGLCCTDSNPSLNNVTIENNAANYNGGGIQCSWYSNPILDNVTIADNSADFGGGIDCYESSPILRYVIISGNFSDYDGGAIYCCYNSNPSLVNVLITGNLSEETGGAIYCYDSSPIINNSTITNNCANLSSCNFYCNDNSFPSLMNCILCNNIPQEFAAYSSFITVSYSNITGGWEGTGNINESPLFAGTGEHPYALLEGSPCIDTGIPEANGLNLPPSDIIGNERIWDGDGDGTAIIDMGAYEYGAPEVGASDDHVENCPVIVLHQNYPNPFNPTTTISFELTTENTGSTELVIYNIKGQKIRKYSISNIPRTVIHSLRGRQYSITNDQYSVTWDGTDDQNKPVTSGIYLYKLQAGKQVLTKKMILLK